MTRKQSQPTRKKKHVKKRSARVKQPQKQRFQTEVELISSPVRTSRIYRETDLQIHAKARCLVGVGEQRDEYIVHFVRPKVATDAMSLRCGDRLLITEATFNEYPPRSGKVEIHARGFVQIRSTY